MQYVEFATKRVQRTNRICCLVWDKSVSTDRSAAGTMGWHAKLADSMLKSVGFSEVKLLDWDGGINQFYLASV